MNITIIGAGIGGLTTAIALKQKGFEVELFEAAPEIREVGAGISLAFNAMQVYQHLGLAETIRQAGYQASRMKITDAKLKPISCIDLAPFYQKYGVPVVAIHRGVLQKKLVENLEGTAIHLHKKLKAIEKDDKALILHFEDGTQHSAQLLIGADGIHSPTRNYVYPEAQLRDAHQPCWRGITHFELPAAQQHQLLEMWGKGKRFGFTHIDGQRVYWYALVNQKADSADINLAATFQDFNPLVGQIIESTPTDKIIKADLIDLKPIDRWHTDNICLIGDAAHATTPNMGQGACQAIEDAWVLSNCLAKDAPPLAFQKFQALRMPKAKKVVNMSWQIGGLAHWENSIGVWLRNALLRATPKSIAQRQNEWIYEVNAGGA